MDIKVIKSSNDYAHAMARLTALMTLDPKDGSKEDNELELLARVAGIEWLNCPHCGEGVFRVAQAIPPHMPRAPP